MSKRLPKWVYSFNYRLATTSRENTLEKALRIAWKALDKIDNGTNTQSLIACGAKQDIERLGGG